MSDINRFEILFWKPWSQSASTGRGRMTRHYFLRRNERFDESWRMFEVTKSGNRRLLTQPFGELPRKFFRCGITRRRVWDFAGFGDGRRLLIDRTLCNANRRVRIREYSSAQKVVRWMEKFGEICVYCDAFSFVKVGRYLTEAMSSLELDYAHTSCKTGVVQKTSYFSCNDTSRLCVPLLIHLVRRLRFISLKKYG